MSHTTSNICRTRSYLKNNINDTLFDDYEGEAKQIFHLLQSTVETGESNSVLLIGPRGAGKTTLVKTVITKLRKNKLFTSNVVLVQLHGLVHTDDRLALKSATSQMNLDNAVDGKVFGSFAENLAFLLACLKTGDKSTAKSIIFILEEFDLFCTHHNQTLLYNLFDVSQSAQTPLCILGITCRLDVIELLEKRVKSRFSHRQIFLFPGQKEESDISDLDLCLQRIESLISFTNKTKSNISSSYKTEWNNSIQKLVNNKKFKSLIQRLLDIDLNLRTLKNILVSIVSKLSEEKLFLNLEDFQEEINNLEGDEVLQILQDLTVLELCLLIAMKHHSDIYDNQPMNFEMIFTRYIKFANSTSNIQNVQRPVVMKAFEHIQNMELMSEVSVGGGKLQKEYQMFKLLVTPQQILEAIKKSQGIPTEVVQWASSSISMM